MKVSIHSQNLVKLSKPVEAIATLVNVAGINNWKGGVDNAIKAVAGKYFHQKLEAIRLDTGLKHTNAIVIDGKKIGHKGNFNDVIFMVDQFETPLRVLVAGIIAAAQKMNYRSIALPVFRSGEMMGIVEETKEQIATEIKEGFDLARRNIGDWDLEVQICVFNDPAMEVLLNIEFSS